MVGSGHLAVRACAGELTVRVLITGAGGQLGQALQEAFADHDVVACTRAELDITDEPTVAAKIRAVAPEVVVNAAAMTHVDGCETDPMAAHRINALGPWWLARACRREHAVLVHMSTDYAFGGRVERGPDGRPRPFTEFDLPAPVNAYGRSKVAGEALVRQTLPQHHIVRTSWVAAPHGGGFLPTILRLARDRGSIRVVDDQVSSPTAAPDLAEAIREVSVSGRFGTVHRTNRGSCSRYELAVAALDLLGVDAEVEPVASAQLRRPALRPAFSVLDHTHADALGLTPLATWQDALPRMVAR